MSTCYTCGGPLGALGAGETYEDKMAKFVKQVRDDGAHLKLILSTSEKISGSGAPYKKVKNAFSLPAGPRFSCPGATSQCAGCYAQSGHFVRDNVAPAYAKNWLRWLWLEKHDPANVGHTKEAMSATRGKQAAAELVEAMRQATYFPLGVAPSFRLWESGDFHSQWSVDVWTNVVRTFPAVAFWGYTRTFNLDYSELVAQPNMKLWASTDKVNHSKAVVFIKKYPAIGHAFWWDPKVKTPSGSFVCPATQPERVVFPRTKGGIRARVENKLSIDGRPDLGYAPGACGTCRYCLPSNHPAGAPAGMYANMRQGHVTFLDHDAAAEATLALAYRKLNMARQYGPQNYPRMGPEMEQAIIEAHAEVEALREEERALRQHEQNMQKGLKGLGESIKSGLIDDCFYSYGRPDYFPG